MQIDCPKTRPRLIIGSRHLANFLIAGTFFHCVNLSAHHSFATHYVTNRLFEISGTVTDVQLRMPHSFYYMDVETEGGQIERWEIEAQSVILLRRMGVDGNTVELGQKVRVSGMRSRDPERRVMFANEFLLESGERHVMYRLHGDSVTQESVVNFSERDSFVSTASGAPLVERISGIWLRRPAGPEDVFNRGGESPMPLNSTGLAGRAAYDPEDLPEGIVSEA